MRVLIIEDEAEIRDSIKKNLESECFVVDALADGEAGSYAARTNDYDAVVLDNMLPKKSGLQVCRDIRNAGKTMPIIMLSVKSETNTKVELLNLGADDYLSKPFSFDELLARLHALLRRPKAILNDVMSVEDLVVDCRQHIVTRDDKVLNLSRKEFMLLEYLLRNRGNVLSRGMIMEHVWDMNADPFSNTIESHILSLRRKIDLPGKTKIVLTVAGRGYKIN